MRGRLLTKLGLTAFLLRAPSLAASEAVVELLDRATRYGLAPPALFRGFGWPLPDGGLLVRALADAAPGGAFDPRELERLSAERLGYRAK